MKRIAPARLKINSIENVFVVSDVVEGVELRRVEKVARANALDGDKISELGGSPTKRGVFALGSQGPRVGADGPAGTRGQPRLGARIHHQTRFCSLLPV